MPVADAPGSEPPPCAVVFGDGLGDLEHIVRGQTAARFRVTVIAGGWDQASTGRILTGLVQQTITVVRSLPGWRLDEVRRDNVIAIAGGQMLGADVIASRMVDIS